jgi:hypothetical protein
MPRRFSTQKLNRVSSASKFYKDRRDEYLLYAILALVPPIVAFPYDGFSGLSAGSLISVLMAAHFFRLAHAREIESCYQDADYEPEKVEFDDYEKSLEDRTRSPDMRR